MGAGMGMGLALESTNSHVALTATSALSLSFFLCNMDFPLCIRQEPNEMILGPQRNLGGHSDVPSCTDNQSHGYRGHPLCFGSRCIAFPACDGC